MKYKTKVILEANGKSTWYAAVSFKSSCKFDVRNFPFDEQVSGVILDIPIHCSTVAPC